MTAVADPAALAQPPAPRHKAFRGDGQLLQLKLSLVVWATALVVSQMAPRFSLCISLTPAKEHQATLQAIPAEFDPKP